MVLTKSEQKQVSGGMAPLPGSDDGECEVSVTCSGNGTVSCKGKVCSMNTKQIPESVKCDGVTTTCG